MTDEPIYAEDEEAEALATEYREGYKQGQATLTTERLAQALHDAGVGCLHPIALSRDVCGPQQRAGAFHLDAAAAILSALNGVS